MNQALLSVGLGEDALRAAGPLTITGACGVPTTVRSPSINSTITGPTDAGTLRFHPAGSSAPPASVINHRHRETRANDAVVPLGAGGALEVQRDQATGTMHFILDVNGYFD